jgi:hypothetical protein
MTTVGRDRSTFACWNDGHICPNTALWLVNAQAGMGIRYACDDHLADTVRILAGKNQAVVVTRWQR